MHHNYGRQIPITIFIAIFYWLFFTDYALALAGQKWDIAPSRFDKFTTFQVNCDGYLSDIETVIGQDDGTLYVNGEAPVCGQPFVLYDAIFSVAGGELDYGPDPEFTIALCLSNGLVTGLECLESDPTVVKTTYKIKNVAVSTGRVQYRPEVVITVPKEGDLFSSDVIIEYQATDKNDFGIPAERDIFGFGAAPASVFYSDQIAELDYRLISGEKKILIAKDLQPAGQYKWDTSNILEGDNYRIVVNAIDNGSDIGESVSGLFSIDHTVPFFKVATDPAVTRGEDVKIMVDVSEDLRENPALFVAQRGYRPIEVPLTGEKNHFEGVYKVITGYDGPAKITVSGLDLAGNKGDTILSGGRFSVGVEPPPKPIIVDPLNNDLATAGNITIKGRIREDAIAILLVNGKTEYKAKPDSEGNFVFENVAITPEFQNGVNVLSVTAQDEAGNTSEAASVNIKFNISPEISIVAPTKGKVLEGEFAVIVRAKDKNKDSLIFKYEASYDNGKTWISLVENATSTRFLWDTREYPDGEYILRVTADDGTAKTQAVSPQFTVKNLLPVISIVGGEKIIVNTKDVVIGGLVASAATLGDRPQIISVEYKIGPDGDWKEAVAEDGVFNTPEERFRVSLFNLKEGEYQIFFRAKNGRGLIGRWRTTVIIDFGPPASPTIIFPKSGSIISDSHDENPGQAGVQFTISGSSEAKSEISVVIDDKTMTSITGSDGAFSVKGVTLRRHGENNLKIFATDGAENKSKEGSYAFVYNNPPKLKFLRPRLDDGIHHKATVQWEAVDNDLDQVQNITLSYRRGSEATFTILAKDITKDRFIWDVSNFAEGSNYELRLEASDGVSNSTEIIRIFIDNTAPSVNIEPLTQTAFRKSFTFEARGRASDGFSGVEFVEYSIDGEHWFKAIITDGFLGLSASFKMKHPFQLEDGSYRIQFRAVDRSGNVSKPVGQEIIVDTTPPRVGSFTLSSGIFTLIPEKDDTFKVVQGHRFKFVLSTERDTKSVILFLGDQKIDINKNRASGLWEEEFVFSGVGALPLKVRASDELGNTTKDKELGVMEVIKRGKVFSKKDDGSGSPPVGEAKITVFVFNEDDQSFNQWPGSEYRAENPLYSDKDGEYRLLLPGGRYYISIQKVGFSRLKSSNFILLEPKFINFDFELEKRKGIRGFFENKFESLLGF